MQSSKSPRSSPLNDDAPVTVATYSFCQSFGQRRLWFLHEYDKADTSYGMQHTLRVRGGLKRDRLERAIEQLLARHESLRTVFRSDERGEEQIVLDHTRTPLEYVDVSGLPVEARAQQQDAVSTEFLRRPFDLAAPPLVRFLLVGLSPSEHVLVCSMHHIISDAWSMGVLVRDLVALYSAANEGKVPDLPELPIQYADYAVWQRERFESGQLDEALEYWRKQLSGAPALLELPTDRPRPAVATNRGATLGFFLDEEFTRKLRALALEKGATLFMIMQAAFAVLLSRVSGASDICMGVPVAGRNRAELEGLIGFFVNTLVLRTRVDGQESFGQLLQQAKCPSSCWSSSSSRSAA